MGLLVGPTVLNLFHFNPLKESALLEVLTEMVVLISLWPTRSMVGWFGVRGIGSLYYLMFAIQHSLPEDLALDLIQLTLIPVTLSILVHGTSVKPLMSWFLRHRSHQSGVNGVKPSQPSETKTVQADK